MIMMLKVFINVYFLCFFINPERLQEEQASSENLSKLFFHLQ